MTGHSNQSSEPESEDAPISVLLVDDNEQWVELLASRLESEEGIRTSVALSANEALVNFRERPSIECIVTDYRMPETDGLQLLERVREEDPEFPFILLTGMGSEEIASRAIQAGVSDYFRKDPKTDQTAVLANRIRKAVGQYRLSEQLKESEERYRVITEQISDAIVILRDGRVRFCNDRLPELTGYETEALHDAEFIDELVHPDDRSRVREVLAGPARRENGASGSRSEEIHDARIRTADGRTLDCEYTAQSIPFENETATLASLRDVTARKARQRNLEREREMNRVVQRALVESHTRSELESEIAELLCEFGYRLAWIGEVVDGTLRPNTAVGTSQYVEDVPFSLDDPGASDEPGVWTARTGDARFTGDFEELFESQWRDRGLEWGFRSAGAIPLTYEDVTYGVLAVYHEDPHHMDEREQTLLSRVGETLGFAIHHTEVKRALSSTHVVDVEAELTEADYYLTELLTAPDIDHANATVTVHGTHTYDDDEVIQYASIEGIPVDAFSDLASAHPAVQSATVIDSEEGTSPRVQLTSSSSPPELALASQGAVVRSTTVTPDRVVVRFELASRNDLRDVLDALEGQYGSVSVRSCVDSERETSDGVPSLIDAAGLTEKQAAALRAAYHHGYYEQPRKSSAKEIADALGIVHSTYLQHLRAAQQKVFANIYNGSSAIE